MVTQANDKTGGIKPKKERVCAYCGRVLMSDEFNPCSDACRRAWREEQKQYRERY